MDKFLTKPPLRKVAIVGSRSITNYSIFKSKLESHNLAFECIISGGANGVDSLAKRYATEHGIKLVEILPDWKTHGKGAGLLRNTEIVKMADVVIAFWDGVSRGTKDSIEKATAMKKECRVIKMMQENEISS